MGGLGLSSASLLAFPAFLACAFGASDFLTTIFSEPFEDVSFTKALEKWLSLTNEQESPLDGTQKNWTQPVYVKIAQDLISRMDGKRSKVFNAHQGMFGPQRLNVVPCKNQGLKLDDQQLQISIGLRLGANICVAQTCHRKSRTGRFTRSFLHQECWSLLISCYSQFCLNKADVGVSRLAFNARTTWTVPN